MGFLRGSGNQIRSIQSSSDIMENSDSEESVTSVFRGGRCNDVEAKKSSGGRQPSSKPYLPNPPPELEPPAKKSCWIPPGCLRAMLPLKRNSKAPALPSTTRGLASKVPTTQKTCRGKTRKGTIPFVNTIDQKNIHVISDEPKIKTQDINKRTQHGPPPNIVKPRRTSASVIIDEISPVIDSRGQIWQHSSLRGGDAIKEEDADNLSDRCSSNSEYIKRNARTLVELDVEKPRYNYRRKIDYDHYINEYLKHRGGM